MGIALTCHCGKKMVAREKYAGRNVRCPQCGAVVPIPMIGLGHQPEEPHQHLAGEEAIAVEPHGAHADIIPFQDARPAAPAAVAIPRSSACASPNPWEDRSLVQCYTPWRPGDRERFEGAVSNRRNVARFVLLGVLALAVAGGAAAWIAFH